MKRFDLRVLWLLIVVSMFMVSSPGFAEWIANNDFPLIGDPNAKKGGEIRYAVTSYPSTFRVHGPGSNTSLNSLMSGMVYQSLIGVHPNTLEFIPDLAEAWEIKDNNMTFLFRLNPKAKWEDGKPVTPEDVVFSWELVTDPKTQDPYAADLFSRMFEKPEVVDAHTVKFVAKTLHWRNFLFCGGLEILPAHTFRGKDYVKNFNWKMPNGSGPYKLWKFSKGNNIIFKRREDFWAKDEHGYQGVNNFDLIKFVIVRDQTLMFEKFKKGELDFYYVNIAREWVQETNFDKIQKGWIQKRKIYTFQPRGVYGIALNMRRPPLDDVRVRKALAYLYNRPVFMEKLFFNEYVNMYSYFPGSIYGNPDNEKIEYDPEKARQLLAEAGWSERNNQGILMKDGQTLTLTLLYTDKGSERHLTIFQEDLKKAGIELKLQFIDWTARIKLTDERNFDMANAAWTGMLFPNVESDFHSKYADINQTNNITGIKNPKIDEILDKYPEMFDLNERIEALRKLDGLIYEEHPYILNWYGPFDRILYWNRFGMPASYFTKTGDYDNILSLWWYDEEKDKALQEAMKNRTTLPVGETEVKYWLEKEGSKQ
jgi:microcin C transport system substrate-binding protein